MAKDETMIDKFVEKCDIVKILWSYARLAELYQDEREKAGEKYFYRYTEERKKKVEIADATQEFKKLGGCLHELFSEFVVNRDTKYADRIGGGRKGNKFRETLWLEMKMSECKVDPYSISVFVDLNDEKSQGENGCSLLGIRVVLELMDKTSDGEEFNTFNKLGDNIKLHQDLKLYPVENKKKIKYQIGKCISIDKALEKQLRDKETYSKDKWQEQNREILAEVIKIFELLIPYYKHIFLYNAVMNETERNIIFYGPPGTGKTREAKKRAAELLGRPSLEDTPQDQYAIVQFHPGYTYSDFVEGIGAVEDGFQPQKKGFRELVERANKNPYNKYVLIIDEINRANVAEVFGELIYGLEYRGSQITTPLSGVDMQGSESEVMEPLCIPKNLAVIGTMNTADKSLMPLDYAVRRRFAFEYFGIDKAKENFQATDNVKFAENICNQVQKDIDKYIVRGMDSRDVMPGISYFIYYMDKGGKKHLEYKLRYELIPLLKEYVKNGMFSKRNGGKEFIEAIQSKDGEDYINTLRKLETPDR